MPFAWKEAVFWRYIIVVIMSCPGLFSCWQAQLTCKIIGNTCLIQELRVSARSRGSLFTSIGGGFPKIPGNSERITRNWGLLVF